jgi:hypothetical protein
VIEQTKDSDGFAVGADLYTLQSIVVRNKWLDSGALGSRYH